MKVSTLRNKADKLFQEYLRDKNKYCEMCGKPLSTHHHFYPKSSSSALRYVEENMISVCVGCHLGFHSNRSSDFTGRLIKQRGIKWFNSLQLKRSVITKATIGYYKEIISRYENKD